MTKAGLAAENGQLKAQVQGLQEALTTAVSLKHFPTPEGWEGRMSPALPHWFIGGMAELLVEQMRAIGGTNYVEWRVAAETELGPLSLTLQRVEGKTPGELKHEAEKERDRLKGTLESVEWDSKHCCLLCDGAYPDHNPGCKVKEALMPYRETAGTAGSLTVKG